ncbi:hypothetical protein [Roseibium sp.]|uniref:hypothetical protein n=1 Tax=Roseibium sp. TaxID=1936156 RepID=UPI003B50977A
MDDDTVRLIIVIGMFAAFGIFMLKLLSPEKSKNTRNYRGNTKGTRLPGARLFEVTHNENAGSSDSSGGSGGAD